MPHRSGLSTIHSSATERETPEGSFIAQGVNESCNLILAATSQQLEIIITRARQLDFLLFREHGIDYREILMIGSNAIAPVKSILTFMLYIQDWLHACISAFIATAPPGPTICTLATSPSSCSSIRYSSPAYNGLVARYEIRCGTIEV